MIIGVDNGRKNVKVFTPQYSFKYPSSLAVYRERDIESELSKHEYIIEYKGQKWFGGYLAQKEGFHEINDMGLSKVHDQTIINILTPLTNFDEDYFQVVTGVPIRYRKDKIELMKILNDVHEITVNRVKRKLKLEVEIAKEGAGGFWANPKDGLVRILDFGSRTTNYVTVRDYSFIDKESSTFDFGFDSEKITDVDSLCLSIINYLKSHWKESDFILLIGGGALQAYPIMKQYFPNTYVAYEEYSKEYPVVWIYSPHSYTFKANIDAKVGLK